MNAKSRAFRVMAERWYRYAMKCDTDTNRDRHITIAERFERQAYDFAHPPRVRPSRGKITDE